MRDWQLDLYIASAGVTPLAVFYIALWAMGGYQ